MTPLTPGELLAIYAILASSTAPGAPSLAARVKALYDHHPRPTQPTEGDHDE